MTHDQYTVYGLMLQVYKASMFTFMSWLQTGTELRAGEWLELCWWLVVAGAGGEIWSVVAATTTTSTQPPSGGGTWRKYEDTQHSGGFVKLL